MRGDLTRLFLWWHLGGVGDQCLPWWEISLPSFVRGVVLQLGAMSIARGDASRVSPCMDFRAALGSKSPSKGTKTFVNNLFDPDLGIVSASMSNGSWILKINGCLERCKERLKLLIPLEMITNDVE